MYKAILICTLLALGFAPSFARPGNPDTCANEFFTEFNIPLGKAMRTIHDCTTNCVEQIDAMEAELAKFWVAGKFELQTHVEILKVCFGDADCLDTLIQEMAVAVRRLIEEHKAIVQRHLNDLKKDYQDEAECTGKAMVHLGTEAHSLGMDFFACVRP